jgi:general nucleoside transport system ATP-binding protein
LPAAVVLKNITKIFEGGERTIVANKNVSLSVNKGEIHAIIGENGAGKTTLMNILYGMLKPDSGTIEVNGREVLISNPRKAIDLGIGMVHQHFKLVPSLTIAENVVLGYEPKKFGFFNNEKANLAVQELAKLYGLGVDPQWRIQNTPVGIQQRAEILKVLWRGARILILDEPTAVLTPQETRELFSAMRNLVDQGATILFITHKLREVLEISDNVTVIRGGMVVGNLKTSETSEKELARLMVGRQFDFEMPTHPTPKSEVVLAVENLYCEDSRGLLAVKGISFEIHKGEVLGIAGVAHNGQEELAEALIGIRQVTSGKVCFKGENVTNLSPRSIKEMGCGHIPDDRYAEGCAKAASIRENMVMGVYYKPPLAGSFWLRPKEVKKFTDKLIHAYDVRTSDPELPIISLSGGNVQKAIVAREMFLAKDLLIAEQPSRGIDIGATSYIHQEILKLRDKGCGILLISMELSEVLQLSTRILVICEGKVIGERRPEETSEEELGLLMAGISG